MQRDPSSFLWRDTLLFVREEEAQSHPRWKLVYTDESTVERVIDVEDVGSVPFTAQDLHVLVRGAKARMESRIWVPATWRESAQRVAKTIDAELKRWCRQDEQRKGRYPAVCDAAALFGYTLYRDLGYAAQCMWTPDLHHFVRLLHPDGGAAWIVDPTYRQFGRGALAAPWSRYILELHVLEHRLEGLMQRPPRSRRRRILRSVERLESLQHLLGSAAMRAHDRETTLRAIQRMQRLTTALSDQLSAAERGSLASLHAALARHHDAVATRAP